MENGISLGSEGEQGWLRDWRGGEEGDLLWVCKASEGCREGSGSDGCSGLDPG